MKTFIEILNGKAKEAGKVIRLRSYEPEIMEQAAEEYAQSKLTEVSAVSDEETSCHAKETLPDFINFIRTYHLSSKWEKFINGEPPELTVSETGVLNTITASKGTLPGWIACCEKSPDKRGDYLVWNDNAHFSRAEIMRFDTYNNTWFDNKSADVHHPTFWQEITPPQSQEKSNSQEGGGKQ